MSFYARIRPYLIAFNNIHTNPKNPLFWVSSIIQWSILIYLFIKLSFLKFISIFIAISTLSFLTGLFAGYCESKHQDNKNKLAS